MRFRSHFHLDKLSFVDMMYQNHTNRDSYMKEREEVEFTPRPHHRNHKITQSNHNEKTSKSTRWIRNSSSQGWRSSRILFYIVTWPKRIKIEMVYRCRIRQDLPVQTLESPRKPTCSLRSAFIQVIRITSLALQRRSDATSKFTSKSSFTRTIERTGGTWRTRRHSNRRPSMLTPTEKSNKRIDRDIWSFLDPSGGSLGRGIAGSDRVSCVLYSRRPIQNLDCRSSAAVGGGRVNNTVVGIRKRRGRAGAGGCVDGR